ncbi:hypothetical protein GCK72_014577 [Caenorhabditis remanei]|uniref:Tectonic-1-3 domain-containing protein n=1 Tax=Caenorhabditis remanei TaxID=31234 RepID=A0A6A5GUB7_CAERE|nr:hypothetical protein GCK72_014577 [Caenorhabditis remanei]KAF1758119.1 hypothetical protein GCK72_014577 [Caenorhabditis remanei]
MFLFSLVLISSLCSANIQDVCYPSVVRHRIDSVFPTTRLFALLNEVLEGLYFGNPTEIRLFKLPASIIESGFCSGTQSVELRRNVSFTCKPLVTSDMISQCTENSFLNALSLFGNGEFIERTDNKSIQIPRLIPEQLRSPVWNGSACNSVLRSVILLFHTNETNINGVEVYVEYSNLPGNVDNNWFEQEFSVRWVPVIRNNEETNSSAPGIGYKAGEQVFRVQSSLPVPFAVPTLGNCYSAEVSPSSVLFLRPIISVCTIPTTDCEDARAKARSFYEQVYPSEFVSSLSEDAPPAIVGRVNVTWEELSPSSSSCRLPVSSLLQVYYSKQGSTKNYREIIVAGNVQLLLDDIPYKPGQSIRMPISISFTDVTSPPKNVFAALPYIDIRLPHDFFYPFISSSVSVSSSLSCLTVFLICLILLGV